MDLLKKALVVSYTYLMSNYDLNGVPLIFHSIRVMNRGKNLDERIVGVLHDVLEESRLPSETLSNMGFPKHIVEAVELLTRNPNDTYFEYINKLAKNELARNVKIYDLEDNLDIKRFPKLEEKHVSLMNRYLKAYKILTNYVL
jgi:(p)ppGpp synthase/HD superfamily hydrolase